MLFRCNLLAIVGGGRNPRYPTNKVMIWDDSQNRCIGELKFRTEVKAVRLRRDRVVVVLESKVFVYQFKDLKLLDQITTVSNPRGLVALCCDPKTNVLAIPGLTKGTIRVELYDIAKATLIKAHDAELAQFALNVDGSRLASASEKGTLVRIWNCHTGEPLRELRRGMDRAEIYCLTFNATTTHLACSSDKGTIHIFSLAGPATLLGAGGGVPGGGVGGGTGNGLSSNGDSPLPLAPGSGQNSGRHWSTEGPLGNPPFPPTAGEGVGGGGLATSGRSRSVEGMLDPLGTASEGNLSAPSTSTASGGATNNKSMGGMGINFLKGILPTGLVPKYFESEWSFAQVRGIEGRSICAFSKDSSKIFIVCADGHFVVANVEEGECSRLSTTRYLKTVEELHGEDDLTWTKSSSAKV
eukprot:scaffold663_cov169-Ochromonas_danica.AAC.2